MATFPRSLNRSRWRPTPIILSCAAAALVLAACSGAEDTVGADITTVPTTTATTVPAPPTTVTGTTVGEVEDLVRMPLTGEILGAVSEIPDRPALAVKIDNHPQARPQAGMNEADIVFEENVENLTRFAAVFHSADADMIGPIRSGRSQDIAILSGFVRPLFAWSGGNDGVRRLVRNSDLVDLDAGRTPGYFRRSDRRAPHNLYSSSSALWEQTPADAVSPPKVFSYLGPESEIEGDAAVTLHVQMDGLRVRWTYDAESDVYLRFQNDQPHRLEDGSHFSAENVVVMAVVYRPSAADANSPEAQLVGEGPVVVMSRGVVRRGIWQRSSITDGYTFLLADGSPLDLIPGRTFVHLARDRDGYATWE